MKTSSDAEHYRLLALLVETRDQLRGVIPHLDRALCECQPGALRDGLTQARITTVACTNKLRVGLKGRKPVTAREKRDAMPCWSRP